MSNALQAKFSAVSTSILKIGFESFIYDYTPVPKSLEGELITPSLLFMNDVPDDMQHLWSDGGYYQIDPVQHYALNTSAPFIWSYSNPEKTALENIMSSSGAVMEYMNDNHISSGLTVPIHIANNSFATLTGITREKNQEQDIHRIIADFTLLAHTFHESIYSEFDDDMRRCHFIELSKRERECLSYSAQGLTAKEIARLIHRSVATVNMHLNSAIQKLGASNKVQAVVRAIHYRLLD